MVGKRSFEKVDELDGLAADRSPFGSADDIPTEVWGDPQEFDGERAERLLETLIIKLDTETEYLTHEA